MADRLIDRFFTRESLEAFSGVIQRYYPEFNHTLFMEGVFDDTFSALELKERMKHTTRCLHRVLPDNYADALDVLIKAAPHVRGFGAMCLPDYIEQYGINNWDQSLKALGEIGRFITGEFALRPFLDKDLDKVIPYLFVWAKDKVPVLRRLASEGTRPRLPWAMALPALKKDPTPILPILEILKDDESEDIRRSVANHLNDISKDNPDIALDLCAKWYGEAEHIDKIVKHACRTLLKAGDKKALSIFGYSDPAQIKIYDLRLGAEKFSIGSELTFAFDVNLPKNSKVRLEYAISYVKAKNKQSRKVFKIAEGDYPSGERSFKRKHSFADMSTRKHYAGRHTLSILANGEEKAKSSFEVLKKPSSEQKKR